MKALAFLRVRPLVPNPYSLAHALLNRQGDHALLDSKHRGTDRGAAAKLGMKRVPFQ